MLELQQYFPALLRGAGITLVLAALSVVLAVCIGMAGAVAKLYGSRWLVSMTSAYTTLVRGVPEFVMMLLVFYGGQLILNQLASTMGFHAPDVDAFVAAVLTIGFIFGAYYTETFRGAILGVPRGQMEAARAYGFSGWLAFRRILFPQMMRLALPAAVNNWLVLLKATAIASLIGLHDVMFIADQAGRTTQAPMTFYLAACAVYLVVTSGSTACLARARTYLYRGVREGSLHR